MAISPESYRVVGCRRIYKSLSWFHPKPHKKQAFMSMTPINQLLIIITN